MKVSVLVPVYNVENYLAECLKSLTNQTLRDMEIICVNDGSTDNSLSILEDFASRDSRIRIIDKPNTGYGHSMNQALARASGEYIGIVESDDWADPEMFNALYALARKFRAEVAKSEFFEFYTLDAKEGVAWRKSELLLEHECGRVINPKHSPHIFYQQPSIWSAIYHRDFLERHRIRFTESPGASYQDTAFSFKVFACAERVVFTRSAFLHYRQDNLLSSVNDSGKVFAVADEYDEIESFLGGLDGDLSIFQLMRAVRWGTYRWNISRLMPELAESFIDFASRQYRAEMDRGSFGFEYCDANYSREISELIFYPNRVVARRKAQDVAKVSVIFPVFNVRNTVEQSLQSLLCQSLGDIEVVIVDDGSWDGSSEIVEKYFNQDARIRLISQRNSGLAEARNVGMSHASAPLIAFLDSDDLFDSDALERLTAPFASHQCELVVGTSRANFAEFSATAFEKAHLINYLRGKNEGLKRISAEVLRQTDVHVWNKLFRKDVIERFNIQFPRGLLYEDAYFFLSYCWASEHAFYLKPSAPLHTYMRHSQSIMAMTARGDARAIDHIEIVFRLFDRLSTEEIRKKFGLFFLQLLDTYITLALDYAGEKHHEEIWQRVRKFFWNHRKRLKSLDTKYFDELNEMIFSVKWMRDLGKIPLLGEGVVSLIVNRH